MHVQVLKHFLALFIGKKVPQEQLVSAVKLVIIPMLERAFEQNQPVVDDTSLNTIITQLFDPPDDIAGRAGLTSAGHPSAMHHVTCDALAPCSTKFIPRCSPI